MKLSWFQSSDSTAIKDLNNGIILSYRDVYRISYSVSYHFNSGDTVIIIGKLCYKMLCVWWGCWLSGCIVITLDNLEDYYKFKNTDIFSTKIIVPHQLVELIDISSNVIVYTYDDILVVKYIKDNELSNKKREFYIGLQDKNTKQVRIINEIFLNNQLKTLENNIGVKNYRDEKIVLMPDMFCSLSNILIFILSWKNGSTVIIPKNEEIKNILEINPNILIFDNNYIEQNIINKQLDLLIKRYKENTSISPCTIQKIVPFNSYIPGIKKLSKITANIIDFIGDTVNSISLVNIYPKLVSNVNTLILFNSNGTQIYSDTFINNIKYFLGKSCKIIHIYYKNTCGIIASKEFNLTENNFFPINKYRNKGLEISKNISELLNSKWSNYCNKIRIKHNNKFPEELVYGILQIYNNHSNEWDDTGDISKIDIKTSKQFDIVDSIENTFLIRDNYYIFCGIIEKKIDNSRMVYKSNIFVKMISDSYRIEVKIIPEYFIVSRWLYRNNYIDFIPSNKKEFNSIKWDNVINKAICSYIKNHINNECGLMEYEKIDRIYLICKV